MIQKTVVRICRLNVIAVDTVKSIIVGGDKLIAAVGLENLVIVDAEDAVLY